MSAARIALIAATALLACSASASTSSASSITSFRTPSGLINCAYITGPKILRCDTLYRTRFSDTKRCREGDYGEAFGMTPRGLAKPFCISDSVLNENAKTLRYGRTRHYGPFKCTSRRTGLTCSNRHHHGWTLPREAQLVF